MLTFSYRIIILLAIVFSFITNSKISAQPQTNYLESLFQEVEVREKNPEMAPPRMYDTLIKNALSFKLLNKYPKLVVGKILFSTHVPKDLEGREADIRKGQDLILNDLATPAMLRDSVTFKDLLHQIDLTFQDSRSPLRYPDWIVIASAFRTLSAPDSKKTPNALGIFVTEYIILMLIDDLEKKSNRTKEENELLSTLYYILSQIYQNIINNPDEYYFVKKKKEKKYSPLYLALPKMYYADSYYDDTYIEPITHLTISEYDIPYDDPYFYSIFISYDVTYDILLSYRLDLLRTAVIVTPYYDVAWIPIIRYIAVDLRSPFYVERLTPVFWNNYFPLGIVGVEPIYIDKVYNRWEKITTNDPRVLSQIQNPQRITNSLREIRSPEWRKKQERKEERGLQKDFEKLQLEEGRKERSLQERQERLGREERSQESRIQREKQEQLQLEQKQERLGREERNQESRIQRERGEQLQLKQKQERLRREEKGGERRIQQQKQEQRQLEQKQEKLRHEEKGEERRIQQQKQEQRQLEQKQERLRHEERGKELRIQQQKQEQRQLEQKQEKLRQEERGKELRIQQEKQEQHRLQQEQERIHRERSQQKQMMEQKIERLKSQEKREAPRPQQEMKPPHIEQQKQAKPPHIEQQKQAKPPHIEQQKQAIESQGPAPQGGPKPEHPKKSKKG